ncbi:MAG: hypothetical protein JRD93_12290 [Deltaproteobacteria bacterium]|nr:hypothetical protein [Deltaproteobacteria bacterium]MBW2662739.1 hypothetical protein [Deltaproteobacteria bacterium]
MDSYNKEQSNALEMLQRHLSGISVLEREKLEEEVSDYLLFRDEVGSFLSAHFSEVCTQKCYQSKLSACCSREGIITFWGDVVINALVSQENEINELLFVLKKPNDGFKCVYLGENGCMWKIKPIVCEMFLCEQAKKDVFDLNPDAAQIWEELKKRKKLYTWPDRVVLFDTLEKYFIDAGYLSPLMYMHNSPGLLRVKRRAQQKIENRKVA